MMISSFIRINTKVIVRDRELVYWDQIDQFYEMGLN
jgi:hypothetical protein